MLGSMAQHDPHDSSLLRGACAVAARGAAAGLALPFLLLTLSTPALSAQAPCAGTAPSPAAAADCTARNTPVATVAPLDPNHTYSLTELIDLAEHNNPRTRIAWEQAKQRANALGVEKSAYFPLLVFQAIGGDQRTISPFPKSLEPQGFNMVEIPIIQPGLNLQYLLFDFGTRSARVDAALADKIVGGANFVQANQEVAFRVATAYYRLLTAQERLQATRETLKTGQTTQDAAEAQLANGRSTIPDVLNAKAETSQDVFDMESADGDEKIARVELVEQVGAEPTPNINIDAMSKAPLPETLTVSIEELIERAVAGRPDLAAQAAEIRAAEDRIKVAKGAYKPRITLTASGAQTSIWPTADYGALGRASEPTWSAILGVEWRVFDGGARRNLLESAQSQKRQAQDEYTERHDRATREVWTAYIAFRTALKKQQAAVALMEAANESYGASLEAYKYGVKNLIDVVTAERQLAQARLSGVSARSQLFLEAVDLEFVTGNLLRSLPPATKLEPKDGAAK
ncbi:TolC family protein [Granulicella tundricola]|uniref:Outer membrane efflux protein n=1 Tax=Granulicella tundricola (strain ATCC BAA-1859 / DSM 23138 / MP5ACTX9) TaxID=1198114 RepID=E8WX24_GRATM|nr:TolC family protein [Granulicella tundricola]ADW68585.1 outer membrane efflux protein [Granulicella tundricola MP5ACTX9]